MRDTLADGVIEKRRSYSLIGGRVLGADSERETIFAIDVRADSPDPNASRRLAAALFDDSVDVALCYCSVYDECWIARWQDVLKRSRVSRTADDEEKRIDCASVPRSGI